MIKTRFSELMGIDYPIVSGGMMMVSTAQLVSAVANAGALGFLTALTQPTPDDLRQEIIRTRELTDKPFGVNLTMLPTIAPVPYEEYLQAAIGEGVTIFETAGRSPKPYMSMFQAAGVKLIHKCTSVRHAISAEKLGVDVISIDGFECAGHPGEDDIPGLVLIPATVDQLTIPVIASGGFGDGRGLAAALALGADGINMGTRFLATQEAPVHENVKRTLVDCSERDTQILLRPFRNTARYFKNSVAVEAAKIEQSKPDVKFEDIRDLVAGARGRKVYVSGDIDEGVWSAGMVLGLINDVPTCAELVARIGQDAEEIIREKLGGLIML